MTYLFVALLALGHASLRNEATLTGWIAAFDEKIVKLYVQGQFVEVPRTSLVPGTRVAVGQEATAIVNLDKR